MILRGWPAILIELWLTPNVAGAVDDRSFFEAGGSLYAAGRKKCRWRGPAAGSEVSFCNQEEAELLAMPFGAPLLGLASIAFAKDWAPVEWSRSLGRFPTLLLNPMRHPSILVVIKPSGERAAALDLVVFDSRAQRKQITHQTYSQVSCQGQRKAVGIVQAAVPLRPAPHPWRTQSTPAPAAARRRQRRRGISLPLDCK